MGTGHQLHRVHQVGVPGDLPVMITIQPDDLSKDMSITGVGLGTGGGVPLPVPRRGQRVDREHPVTGRPQRRHPRAAVGLDPDHHPARDLLAGQVGPIRRGVLRDQRMESGDALQSLRQAGLRQPPARLVLQLEVVMILGPVVPDEQQHLAATPSLAGHGTQHPATPAT